MLHNSPRGKMPVLYVCGIIYTAEILYYYTMTHRKKTNVLALSPPALILQNIAQPSDFSSKAAKRVG